MAQGVGVGFGAAPGKAVERRPALLNQKNEKIKMLEMGRGSGSLEREWKCRGCGVPLPKTGDVYALAVNDERGRLVGIRFWCLVCGPDVQVKGDDGWAQRPKITRIPTPERPWWKRWFGRS